jgi:hypothetical protein
VNPHLRNLIERYLAAVGTAVETLRRVFSETDLLWSVSTGLIPYGGQLGSESFRFHGVGCEYDFGDYFVDFHFGPDGRCDGFDAWRLWIFARQFPEEYPEYQEVAAVELELAQAETDGLITSPKLLPSPHLKYLADFRVVPRGRVAPS